MAVWAAFDMRAIAAEGSSIGLTWPLAFGVGLVLVAAGFRWRGLRPVGLGLVGATYVLVHLLILGFEIVFSLLFIVLLISHLQLQVVAERFGPLYRAALSTADRARMGAALGRAIVRLGIAAVLGVLLPMLAANLAVAGVVSLTTIPSAILLAAALVVIVLIIAILPTLSRRPSFSEAREAVGEKDN